MPLVWKLTLSSVPAWTLPVPVTVDFQEALRPKLMLTGFGLPDDALHSPNEKFNISHFYNGIRSVVRLLDRLGDVSP